MVYCKLMRRKKANTEHEVLPGTSRDKPSLEITVKKEQIEYDEQNICRVCLKEGSIPIYGNSDVDNICDALKIFGGILVSPDDEYPKYLCLSCNRLLQDAILFRTTAQKSEQLLRQRSKDATITEDKLLNYEEVKLEEVKLEEVQLEDVKLEDVKLEDVKPENDLLVDDNLEDEILVDKIVSNTDDNSLKYQVKKEVEEYNVKKDDNQIKYHCEKCDLNFQTQKEYTKHKLSKEHKDLRVTCNICNKIYASSYLKQHLALHEGETHYICDICGKKCTLQLQLNRHRSTHFYNLPHKCSLCPYRGRVKDSLRRHMRTHTGDKPYKCPQCPQCYSSKGSLNRHMIRHNNKKDFKCNQCEKEFNTKFKLNRHYKAKHIGVKDHVCNICNKVYGSRDLMLKHQRRMHKREKMMSGLTPLYLCVNKKLEEQKN